VIRSGSLRARLLRETARRAGGTVARGIRLWSRTWRLDIRGAESIRRAREISPGIVYCFWHGRMLELVNLHADESVGLLMSPHRDGTAAAHVVRRLGYVSIPGSRKRRPLSGFRTMLRHAATGRDIALTPDAHAPDRTAHPGAVALARRSGYALVAVAAGARPRLRLRSWDRFEIPLPGARVVVRYGGPRRVPKDADREAQEGARRALEEELERLHADIERELGRSPEALRAGGSS